MLNVNVISSSNGNQQHVLRVHYKCMPFLFIRATKCEYFREKNVYIYTLYTYILQKCKEPYIVCKYSNHKMSQWISLKPHGSNNLYLIEYDRHLLFGG